MAHPYTSLGGCYDDLVVLSVVAELVKIGIVVGTFNFRYRVRFYKLHRGTKIPF